VEYINFSEFFTLISFWTILALKKCWADWPNPAGERVKLDICTPFTGPDVMVVFNVFSDLK
jgi:hypothetical protein